MEEELTLFLLRFQFIIFRCGAFLQLTTFSLAPPPPPRSSLIRQIAEIAFAGIFGIKKSIVKIHVDSLL